MSNNSISNSRLQHYAFVTARSYARDGYHLVSYDVDEATAETRYNLVHDNGNFLTIFTDSKKTEIRVLKNGRLNNIIKL